MADSCGVKDCKLVNVHSISPSVSDPEVPSASLRVFHRPGIQIHTDLYVLRTLFQLQDLYNLK